MQCSIPYSSRYFQAHFLKTTVWSMRSMSLSKLFLLILYIFLQFSVCYLVSITFTTFDFAYLPCISTMPNYGNFCQNVLTSLEMIYGILYSLSSLSENYSLQFEICQCRNCFSTYLCRLVLFI